MLLADGIRSLRLLGDDCGCTETYTWRLDEEFVRQVFSTSSLILLDLGRSNFTLELRELQHVRDLSLRQVLLNYG